MLRRLTSTHQRPVVGRAVRYVTATNPDAWRSATFGTDISRLAAADAGRTAVTVRGRLESATIKGKLGFMIVRQPGHHTIQVVLSDPSALQVAKTLTPESIVEIDGSLSAANVKKATCDKVELHATALRPISVAATPLPFDHVNAKLDTRLNERPFDLRSKFNDAVFHVSSTIAAEYRDYMRRIGFTEINTPKILPTPSEGGSSVFTMDYFGTKAYLAQSPQLYKQMCVMGDLPRVFEVGSVFRAENSNTHRHLTEFIGLDAEMAINKSYTEVLDVLEGVVTHVLTTVEKQDSAYVKAARELAPSGPITVGPIAPTVADDHPLRGVLGNDSQGIGSTDKYGARVGSAALPVLRLPFDGAMQMLIDDKFVEAGKDDFNTAMEKRLGQLVRERYGVDLVVCDQYPSSARPFYTHRDPSNDLKTFSYDLLLRGEEICSGAQRLHNVEQLKVRAKASGVQLENIQPYIDCFRFGAWPHGGFGLGLQRMVMLYLGLPDVRYATLFPRDPTRSSP